MNKQTVYVLGLHPSSRGFGWVLFEGPLAPFDWGTADIRNGNNLQVLNRFDALMVRCQPQVLALETFDDAASRRGPRIRSLCRSIVQHAKDQRLRVYLYSRADIHAALACGGTKTREQVAAVVAKQIEPFRPRLPKRRAIWVGEHPSLALFAAAACVLTHYAITNPEGHVRFVS